MAPEASSAVMEETATEETAVEEATREEEFPPLLTLTPVALREVKQILKEQEMSADTVLRVKVVGGGCAGFQYHMGLEEEAGPNDEVMHIDGVTIAVDEFSAQYIDGVTVDFVESIAGRGFTFDNPQAKSTCGCGSSFNA
ncbi:MAG: iron-sulfur cluster assembly accessory protein [Planctomycetota bacterium]|nr:iron-sulfur cluster assembly accessory protein [Planctomycetota bacterium]MDA1142402.1 iron-sulfur cluster assembly accessory protein [Planctomycetota bacterium]